MKCLVINLDRSPARLAHVTAEFIRIGIAFERVAAIDAANQMDLSRKKPRAEHSKPLRLTDAEIACFLSHRVCWAIVAAGDDAYGAIFEDDAVFAATAGPLLADDGWIPADADIIKLETFFQKTVVGMNRVSVGHGYSVSRLYGGHFGTGGYIISRQAARRLIDATEEPRIPVDCAMFHPACETSSSKTIYQLVPALCVQDQFLNGKATRLPSLINQQRRTIWEGGPTKKRKTTVAQRIANEVKRTWRRIVDICRLRRERTIPFFHRGKRARPPHTQNRENAL
jgi:glycosyl transferase family 25